MYENVLVEKKIAMFKNMVMADEYGCCNHMTKMIRYLRLKCAN